MDKYISRVKSNLGSRKSGMELVQVAILIAIAIALGILFKDRIGDFVKGIFNDLDAADLSNKF